MISNRLLSKTNLHEYFRVVLRLEDLQSATVSGVHYFVQKQPPEVFYKKGVLKNFTKFTGKYLCQSLFFNKVEG